MTSADRIRLTIIAAWTLLCFAAGWASCHYWERPAVVPVPAHAQQTQRDGSTIAGRDANATPPRQAIPIGSTPTLTFTVATKAQAPVLRADVRVVQEQQKGASDAGSPLAASGPAVITQEELDRCKAILQCPAEHIDGTLVTNKDGTPDLLLSGEAGTQIGVAQLSVIKPVNVARIHLNALGIARPLGLPGASMGLVAEHDFQALPLRVTGTAFMLNGKPTWMVGALYRW